jgi:hypothetical protein
VDFVGQVRATDNVAENALDRCPLARAPIIALLSSSLSPHRALSLPGRTVLWSVDPPAIRRSLAALAALTLTPSLPHSPSPTFLSPPAAASSFFLDTPLRLCPPNLSSSRA